MKNLLLSLVMLLPIQAIAADDSVYTWGAWSQGIQPAAGGAHAAIPAPIQTPNTSFRPNEHSALKRSGTLAIPNPQRDRIASQIGHVFGANIGASQGSNAALTSGGSAL